jgi:hypothetical protein
MLNALSRAAFARAALIAATVALGAPPAGAHDLHAKAAPCEVTYEHIVEIGRGIVAENPDATFTDYTGAEARKIVDAFNAVEPVSDWTAEHVLVIDPADDEAFRVGIVDKGCLTHAFPAPRGAWQGMVRAALGDKS